MSYVTLEVEIDHGRVVPRGREGLPEKGNGLLTILHPQSTAGDVPKPLRQRVELPPSRGEKPSSGSPRFRHHLAARLSRLGICGCWPDPSPV